ncbi:MAG: HAMP domain-containing protein, partial [Ignavibacteriales bacterium]|nr:HAMP domain-containing protein [Ignavibacteriales bacterium]
SRELYQTTLSDLFVLTDNRGKLLVQIVQGEKQTWDVSKRESIQRASKGSASTDVWAIEGNVFRVASAPIMIERDLIGTLTIGFALKQEEINTLKRATNSEIILTHHEAILLSTLGQEELENLRSAFKGSNAQTKASYGDTTGALFSFTVNGADYLATAYRLNRPNEEGVQPISYLIVKPIEREINRSLKPVMGTFGIISLIFLALTTAIGSIVSKSMTKPINELVKGTTEVSKGNYEYTIEVKGQDELSFLGQKFGEMSKSLKDKITELDKLNKDLIERNKDLDDTLRQLREAQEELVKSERLAATGKLTAQLAHEINNPIHNIQSCLKTSLGRLPQDTNGRELIEVAFDEISRMAKLTRQMLDFYRTSLVPDEMRPLRVNDIVQTVIAASAMELKNHRIELLTEYGYDMPEVSGSKDKLKQVFLNIILNAKDAMPDGGKLRVATYFDQSFAKIAFSDNGIGIPKENLNKIFDAFFTTKGKVSGVGLGLSVSYGIIGQHRGSISVTSRVGEGSTFTVALPLMRETIPVAST